MSQGNLNSGNLNAAAGSATRNIYVGGPGNDVFFIQNSNDLIIENPNSGTDTVFSTVSYQLGDNLENLVLYGSDNIDATGNALDNYLMGTEGNNRLIGGEGNDILDGQAGADMMWGGKGDDLYVVDNPADQVCENPGEGTDSVLSYVSYQLRANVENLVLLGQDNLNAQGNELANVIMGNEGNNRLDGGVGADYLAGGAGNDIYVVDNSGDKVIELPDQGNDSVESSVSYKLTENVENLQLLGSAKTGEGNALDNKLFGNASNNRLYGYAGSDLLIGGGGNDAMDGGQGDDEIYAGNGNAWVAGGEGNDILHAGAGRNVFAFNRGDGQDLILDSRLGKNAVSFGGGIHMEDLSLSRSGSDLLLSLGGGDSIRLKDFYDPANRNQKGLETLQFISDAGAGSHTGCASPDRPVVSQIDFDEVLSEFDRACRKGDAKNPWTLMKNRLDVHLIRNSDGVLGGEMSLNYAASHTLTTTLQTAAVGATESTNKHTADKI